MWRAIPSKTLRRKYLWKEKQKKRIRISDDVAQARLQTLKDLKITIQNENEEGKFPLFKVSDLNEKAEQHIVVIGGSEAMVKDSLLSAKIMKDQFRKDQTLVVPVKISSEKSSLPTAKGFAMNPEYMTQGFVAPPYQLDKWQELLEEEILDAEAQGAEKVRKQGIVLVLRNDGKIIRRGLGVPIWKQVLDELEGRKSSGEIKF
mmetsp:Transcript_22082/g.28597  ORF Transcript_22082/g.28597 Transcript_22082/m.28597 type:complete len:203 (+) Transcript_22082:582-1190(+)